MPPRSARATTGPLGRGPLGASLILIAPLYLAYEVGVMFSTSMNGVDFVTYALYALVGGSRRNFLLLHLALAVLLLVWVVRLRRRGALTAAALAPVCLESTAYALALGTCIVFVVQRLFGLALVMAAGDTLVLGSTGQAVVISLGAGVHEELVFRLVLMGGGVWLLRRSGLRPRVALALALIGSALLFAAAHHLGARGEPFDLATFAFRALAGAVFGLIFWYRSLAHAVYTHAVYDLWVLVIR